MPGSFMSRHRTICSVLEDIKQLALARNEQDVYALCEEATNYAQRMSAKLVEYKLKGGDAHNTGHPSI